jgi:hypothetical protein
MSHMGPNPYEYQRRLEEDWWIQETARRAHEVANWPIASTSSYGAQSVSQPHPMVPASVAGIPQVPQTTSTAAAVPEKSRTGVVVVICLLVLAILVAIIFAAYRHFTKVVTLEEMGIQDKTYATWSRDPNSIMFYDVIFNVNTTNSSEEDRKVKFCTRKEPGTKDHCFTYHVEARSTAKFRVLRPGLYDVDDQNTAGPDQKVVKIDGLKVRA